MSNGCIRLVYRIEKSVRNNSKGFVASKIIGTECLPRWYRNHIYFFVFCEDPEHQTEVDRLAWKRDFNIRQREAEWRRKQDEILIQKQVHSFAKFKFNHFA